MPWEESTSQEKASQKVRKKDKQHGKKRKTSHQDLGGTPPGVKDASPLLHQNTLQSNSSKPNNNLERDHYSSKKLILDNTTKSATIICFACNKVGHTASYCLEKKKNCTPGLASGSTSKSSQTPCTADRG